MKRSGTKDFAFAREHCVEVRNQKGDVVFCHSSMCLTAAEGSLWEKADGELMLRHEMMTKPLNCQETKKIGALRGLGDLGITRKQSKEAAAKKHVGLGKGGK